MADFERAKTLYLSAAMDDTAWVTVFHDRPDVMWSMIADVYRFVRAEQDREAGISRRGPRPRRAPASMEELRRTVMPQHWNCEPFSVALRALIGERSQKQFAAKVPVSQASMSRMLDGSQTPDMAMLESIAAAAKVPAFYFVEHRALFLAELVRRVLTENPHHGITAMKAYRVAARQGGRAT